MAALPAERLDQRLLSGALQHCVALHQAAPTASDAEALGSLLDLALPLLPTFDAFGLCIIVRTAARLQAPLTRQQLLPWCYAAEDRLDSFNCQDLANTLYSLGQTGQRLPQATLSALCAAVQRQCRGMKPQEQANTLLGLSYMHGRRHRSEPPPRDVEAAAVAVLQAAARRPSGFSRFSSQELANLAWGFARVTWLDSCFAPCEAELWALFDEAAARAPQLPPQELANLALAQALTHFSNPAALSGLVEAAAAQAPRLDEQHLHNILLAAAQLPLHMPEPATAGGPPRRCAGLAHLEALRGKLLRRLAVASRPVKGFTPTCQGICRAIWALAVLQSCTPELWHAAMDALQRWAEAGSADYDEGFAQLHHAHQLLAADQPQWHLELPPSLRRRADSAVRGGRGGGVREAPTVSSLQARVAEALRAAGVGPLVEEYPVAGGQSVDIALPEERVAVEVDGPFHYTVNAVCGRRWLLTRTEARDRLLRLQGWRVLVVEGSEWELLPAGTRQEWLLGRLAAVRRESGGDVSRRCGDA